MAADFPPLGHLPRTDMSRVYTLRDHFSARMESNPEQILSEYRVLMGTDADLAQWMAAHFCMLRAGAAKGAWMRVSADQRKQIRTAVAGPLRESE